MDHSSSREVLRVINDRSERTMRRMVEEYPLRLRVNGRDLATLVCSPHQLNFLLTGFFLLQGFIASLDDILAMGICSEYGLAELRIRGELPDRLEPTLTSGCGTGISFNLPRNLIGTCTEKTPKYSGQALRQLMGELQVKAEQYRSHGGIHSAAVGDAHGLLLYAEDIGRHNTLDRLAGEALFRGLDLKDKMLVTSGRVSTEMVAKAARLGIGVLASRTSPTDQAIDLGKQAGMTMIGYLRGNSMEIYSHPERLLLMGTD